MNTRKSTPVKAQSTTKDKRASQRPRKEGLRVRSSTKTLQKSRRSRRSFGDTPLLKTCPTPQALRVEKLSKKELINLLTITTKTLQFPSSGFITKLRLKPSRSCPASEPLDSERCSTACSTERPLK